jgi:hypothetical protein
MASNAVNTSSWRLLDTPMHSVQPLATSVATNVNRCWPWLLMPQWATRSISRKPTRPSVSTLGETDPGWQLLSRRA